MRIGSFTRFFLKGTIPILYRLNRENVDCYCSNQVRVDMSSPSHRHAGTQSKQVVSITAATEKDGTEESLTPQPA